MRKRSKYLLSNRVGKINESYGMERKRLHGSIPPRKRESLPSSIDALSSMGYVQEVEHRLGKHPVSTLPTSAPGSISLKRSIIFLLSFL